jgi:lysyl-tRNA synthetase class I
MNKKLLGAEILRHPIIRKLIESQQFSTSQIIKLIAEQLSPAQADLYINAETEGKAQDVYRNLAKQLHPDRSNDPKDNEAFRQVAALYNAKTKPEEVLEILKSIYGNKAQEKYEKILQRRKQAAGGQQQQKQQTKPSGLTPEQVEDAKKVKEANNALFLKN